MKVVQILPELNAGGVERGTLEIADYLTQQGHEAIVISNGGRMVPALEKIGARHITMPVHRKSLLSLWQVRPLRRLLENERPDIIHIRSRVSGWIAYLAWRGMNPQTRPRLVSTVHGFYSVNRYSAIMTKGERVIAVSNSIGDYICQSYPSTNPEIIRVIHRGVAPKYFPRGYQPNAEWLNQWQTEHPQLAGKKILLLPGRITRLKGHEDFFRLIAALNRKNIPAHGLVVGDNHPKKRAYLEELKAQVAQMGLHTQITFLSHRSDLRDIMAVSHLVCALSRQPESFGRTALEALALGKPVVGYDCGGVGELLSRYFPQGAAPLGNIDQIIDAATSIIRNNPVPMGVANPCTLDAMCCSTFEVYEELAG
jgi:glycosyltransferase involved in cell wall biosynthesis